MANGGTEAEMMWVVKIEAGCFYKYMEVLTKILISPSASVPLASAAIRPE